MRVLALGLWAAMSAVLAPAVVLAGPVDDLLACTNIGARDERLACFDAAAASIEAKGGAAAFEAARQASSAAAASAPTSAPMTPQEVEAAKQKGFGLRLPGAGLFGAKETEADFGSERLQKTEDERLDSIRAGVDDYAYNGFGKVIVFLDNGQVWRQLDSDDGKLRFKKGEKYQAIIERGLIGSYSLKVEGISRMIKVKRIK